LKTTEIDNPLIQLIFKILGILIFRLIVVLGLIHKKL
jgi:hypothetical protein